MMSVEQAFSIADCSEHTGKLWSCFGQDAEQFFLPQVNRYSGVNILSELANVLRAVFKFVDCHVADSANDLFDLALTHPAELHAKILSLGHELEDNCGKFAVLKAMSANDLASEVYAVFFGLHSGIDRVFPCCIGDQHVPRRLYVSIESLTHSKHHLNELRSVSVMHENRDQSAILAEFLHLKFASDALHFDPLILVGCLELRIGPDRNDTINGPGVPSNFERSKETGAWGTAQEIPEITFSEEAENA